jgi:hypothetical protein
MQTQLRQRHHQLSRIAGIATITTSVAVIASLLVWAPSSIGSASTDTAPARLAATPTPAGGAKEVSADPAHGSGDRPSRPTCAEVGEIAAIWQTESAGGPGAAAGCGAPSNLAGDVPVSHQSEDPVDVATFLAWHMQARSSIDALSHPASGSVAHRGRSWSSAPTTIGPDTPG